MPFIMPGIRQPKAFPAASAPLKDDDKVIGVTAGGRARAYLVDAFASMKAHVVNDVVGGKPVTVTHCDRTGCTKALAGPDGGAPLEVRTGGWTGDQLMLMADANFYAQDTLAAAFPRPDLPPFPYPAYPFELTTWGAWRAAHPDTDAYVGEARETAPAAS
jgi:hypothetical protein